MALKIDRAGEQAKFPRHFNYAQVEANHLSAPRAGGVYAQLPAADDIEILENGQFVKYDYAKGQVDFDGEGPWMLVYNEEHGGPLYDERTQMHRDFALRKEDQYDGLLVPRVFRLYAGDIYTTNAVKDGQEYSVGDKLTPGADGWLDKGEGDLTLTVVKEYTLPDGQPGLKLQVTSEKE